MKKTIQGIVLFVFLISITGCGKSGSTTSSGTSKTDLLTKQDWVVTVMQHKAVNGSVWTDDYGSFKSCQKDDRVVFRTNNTYEGNEGPTKCNPNDPQIKATGTWTFAENETILVVKDAIGTQIFYATIQTLSTSSLSLSFTIVDQTSGVTYQFLETYSH